MPSTLWPSVGWLLLSLAGLGALVVRRSLVPLLQRHKAYFGGGTVEVALPDSPFVVR
jgi:hypothetical protein